MEKIIQAPLKRAFICAVAAMTAVIVCLSALTMFGCYRLQRVILPDSNEVLLGITNINSYGETECQQHRLRFGEENFLPIQIGISVTKDEASEVSEEMSELMSVSLAIDKISDGYSMLSPRRKIVYNGLAAAKFILPLVYSIMGIVLCAAWFYRKKLNQPIRLLSDAAKKIAIQDLDFKLSYDSGDEMGLLCQSFEEMRRALYQNNQELWGMVEERRTLMASVAHDLRNPISIMEGYLEYLQSHIPDRSMDYEDILYMVNQTAAAAARLERYTDSLRDLHHLEEQELQSEFHELPELLSEMAEDFVLLGEKRHLPVEVMDSTKPGKVRLDSQVLYRILENVVMNALRFAGGSIRLDFEQQEQEVLITVTDDGCGFPEALLNRESRLFFTTDQTGEHIGMGLTICDILARKHGGSLLLQNQPGGGATVLICIALQ